MANRRSGKTGRNTREHIRLSRHATMPRLVQRQRREPTIEQAIPIPALTPTYCVNCMESLPVYCEVCPRCNFPYRRAGPRAPGTNPY
jgi:hypothetical protein